MSERTAEAFLKMVAGRQGHFRLESGHHGELWLDLNALFAEPRRIAPLVAELTDLIRPHDVACVCGPLIGGAFLAQVTAALLDVEFAFTERMIPAAGGLYPARYRLPPALAPQVRGRRIAIVDDVMSAGSAARGTYEELRAQEAVPIVVGALLVLGSTGADFFAQHGVAIEAVARRPYRLWLPAACPLCDSGVPLEAVS
jgi:orotate phosphoribosyltransferase